jgi:hypothetical protein
LAVISPASCAVSLRRGSSSNRAPSLLISLRRAPTPKSLPCGCLCTSMAPTRIPCTRYFPSALLCWPSLLPNARTRRSSVSSSLCTPLRARQPPLPCQRTPNAVIHGHDLAKYVRRLAVCRLARRPCPLSHALVPKAHHAVVGSCARGFEAMRVRRAASCADILSR